MIHTITEFTENQPEAIRAKWGLHQPQKNSAFFWKKIIQRLGVTGFSRKPSSWRIVVKLPLLRRNVGVVIAHFTPFKSQTSRSHRSSTKSSKSSSLSSSDGSNSDPDSVQKFYFFISYLAISSSLIFAISSFFIISHIEVAK
ncbi:MULTISPECIES: hypothetical protein [Enterobacteriaceae]|uniref:hypothetical protein n=1 Tax=Enterobacteriaceae TaxID=543 RepID=UPI000F8440C6|nr:MULTISPECIES: hypothetical protein [Enterobacteriaceae]ELW9024436.1 hypothetical protein [Yersinia enterocolitica]HDV0589722.1 hypothetical protein [Escherichia coli]EJT4821483.1 hypothetical protein [Citrobacter freundii]MCJ8532461.1 hypothetical protein [Citrobacter freundii]QPS90989.1 hypothetical protein I6G45_15805 [Atlantibacter hermannii]